jgi:hypothetical protein
MTEKMHPLLAKALPLAEDLIKQDHFSIENLCHALDCGLKELAEAAPTVDELFLHINGRFMAGYVDRAQRTVAEAGDELDKARRICAAWYDQACEQRKLTKVLLQHKWSPGFERPEWYMQQVKDCFKPIEGVLAKLAPQAPPQMIGGAARGLYAQIVGLYFLTLNERATPAGIADQRRLLALTVDLVVAGLRAQSA